jgi:hypothetical protein
VIDAVTVDDHFISKTVFNFLLETMVIEGYILRFRRSLAPSGLLTKVVLDTDMHKPAMHDYTFWTNS